MAGEIELACAAAGASLLRFAAAGGWYEPFAIADDGPDQATELAVSMIDWGGLSQGDRRYAAGYLGAACAVIAASRRPGQEPAPPVLDELIGLLAPGQLSSRLDAVPGYAGGRAVLAGRVGELTARAVAGQEVIGQVREQLSALRASAAGQWLRPGEAQGISVPLALEAREVVLFAPGGHPGASAARMLARLVVADLTWTLSERARLSAPADCLVWINGCEQADEADMARLAAAGRGAGAAVVFCTARAGAAERIAAGVNVVVVRGAGPLALSATAADPAVRRWDLPGRGELPGEAAGEPPGAARPGELADDPLRQALSGARQPDEIALAVRAPTARAERALAVR